MASLAKPKGMSQTQIGHTKAEEQFKASPYIDGKSGGRSIGYGFHMNMWPDKAKEIQIPITEEKADELFKYVDGWNANYLAKKLGLEAWNSLDQRQIDALLSVAYNAGAPGVWRDVRADLEIRNFERVAEILEGHATIGHQGDKKVNLSPRRKRDAELFRAGSRAV